MMGSLLIRGMLVGILAGIMAFGFAKIFGEPQVDRAIAFETRMEQAKSHAETPKGMNMSKDMSMSSGMDMSKGMSMSGGMVMTNAEAAAPELVSRATQAGIGLLTGVAVYSAAFGGLFALVFGFVYGRVSHLGARSTAAVLAVTGFIAIYVVPNLKYPANPPAVGLPETIGSRTALFLAMIAISIAAMILAAAIRQKLAAQYGGWNATLIGGAVFLVVVAIAQLLLPSLNEVPDGFPAVVLWNFRIASAGIQIVLWTTLALVFGAVAEPVLRQRQ